jgi:hypothetical protein
MYKNKSVFDIAFLSLVRVCSKAFEGAFSFCYFINSRVSANCFTLVGPIRRFVWLFSTQFQFEIHKNGHIRSCMVEVLTFI